MGDFVPPDSAVFRVIRLELTRTIWPSHRNEMVGPESSPGAAVRQSSALPTGSSIRLAHWRGKYVA